MVSWDFEFLESGDTGKYADKGLVLLVRDNRPGGAHHNVVVYSHSISWNGAIKGSG